MSDRIISVHVFLFDVDDQKDGTTSALKAAFRGHLDVVKFLVTKAGVDPDQPNKVPGNSLDV